MDRKKRILTGTASLFACLLACTLISRSVYAYQLPQVTAVTASKKSIGKKIELSGTVMQAKDHAVSVLPGVKTETVEVSRGQKVQKGELLFTVDMEDLEEQILEKQLSIKKLQVQIQTILENNELLNQKKVTDTNRALEDYVGTVSENDTLVDRARQKEAQARQDLLKHLEDAPQLTKDSDRERAKEEYAHWAEEGKGLEEKVLALQKQLEQAQKEVERLQKEYEEAVKRQEKTGVYFSEETVRKTDAAPMESELTENGAAENEPADSQEGQTPEPQDMQETEEQTQLEVPVEPETGEQTQPEQAAPETENGVPEEVETGSFGETEAGAPEETETLPGAELEALKKRLEAAQARRDEIEAELARARAELDGHQAEDRIKPDFSAEDAERESWESRKTELERSAESAGWEEEDAVRQKQKALKEAQRKVDDAVSPENVQDTLALYQLELDYEQTVLKRYTELRKAGGKVTAEEDGVITGVSVSAGADTPDGAAMTYASLEEDLKFRMRCTKEEKKYIGQGTQGRLVADGVDETLEIGYIEQKEDGSWEAELSLPKNSADMGQSGSFTVDYQSESYSSCIPVEAVYEENNRNYIYVVRPQQGILGEELAAEKRYVTVKEAGDRYAALAEGALEEGEQIIVSTTKALKDGEVIRYRLKERG